MDTLINLSGMGQMLGWMDIMLGAIVAVFLATMFIVLWNTGLMGNIRRYGEIGVRLAMGETKGQVYRSLIAEAAVIGFVGSLIGTALGLASGFLGPAPRLRLQRHDEERFHADVDPLPYPGDRDGILHRLHPGPGRHRARRGHGRPGDLQAADVAAAQGVGNMKRRTTILSLFTGRRPGRRRVPGRAAEENAEAILKKIDENRVSGNKVILSEMIIHGRRGSRTVRIKSWIQGTEKSFSEYLDPPRERGTKMLKLGDQLWTYYPASDRIILIAGHMLRQSVMGSDLSYEDMLEDPDLRATMRPRSAARKRSWAGPAGSSTWRRRKPTPPIRSGGSGSTGSASPF